MALQIGINGFGRIGRSVFRIISKRDDMKVVAINDLFENEQLAYLLKYDTVMGIFQREVTADREAMYVDNQKIVMTEYRDPTQIPWKDLGIDVVIE
ncbi:MAG: glyceraldehyde 3-phosphate dehydrogenase NAD-binding domain-containing protein, partial [Desulfobacterales bacterium]